MQKRSILGGLISALFLVYKNENAYITVSGKEEIAILIVKDRTQTELGVLENAYNISVEMRRNELWTAQFSLPMDDPKRHLCSHLNFVAIYGEPTQATPAGRYYGLYRIMPTKTSKAVETNRVTYELEHVLSTLLDDVIDGLLPALINQPTETQLNRLLNLQTTKHWQLGTVEFERYFQYAFENENGLLAPILSIPKPFDEDYEFTFDTTSYPWTLNLVRPSDAIQSEVRWGKDMISFDEVSDPTEIVNHIIPKGQGEGVNQLTIGDVNNGQNYLEDSASISEWGLRKYIWIDRRFKNAESLKESAQSLLRQWKDPKISFEIDAVDLSVLPEYSHEQRLLGTKTQIIVHDSDIDRTYDARIIEAKIPDLAKEYEVSYKIANRLDDAATIQADVERKQRVNDAYSQGATNIMNADRVENADPTHPIKFRIWIPSNAFYINYMELTWETDYFRAYSQGTKAGGYYQKSSEVQSKSTEDGGAFIRESTVESTSTENGGGTQSTSAAGGDHYHTLFAANGSSGSDDPVYRFFPYAMRTPDGVGSAINLPNNSGGYDIMTYDASGDHVHQFTLAPHSHNFSITIPGFSIPAHSHNFSITIPSIEIPEHTHENEYGIYEHDSLPTSLEIKVDGTIIPESNLQGEGIDITDYIQRDSSGKIQRGRFAEVEIRPTDELAQITANIIWGLFVQSDKGTIL